MVTDELQVIIHRKAVRQRVDRSKYEFRAFFYVDEKAPIRFDAADGDGLRKRAEVWNVPLTYPSLRKGSNGEPAKQKVLRVVRDGDVKQCDVTVEFSLVRIDPPGGPSTPLSQGALQAAPALTFREVFSVDSSMIRNRFEPSEANVFDCRSLFAESIFASAAIVNLRQFECLDRYFRNEPVFHEINRFRNSFLDVLQGRTDPQQAFVIWGPSGWGKTFLPCQLAQMCQGAELLVKKVSEDWTSEFQKIDRLAQTSASVAIVVDEADCLPHDEHFFELLLAKMDALKTRPSGTSVVVFVGSTLSGIQAFKKRIEERNRGQDVLRRVDVPNEIVIPEMTLEEKVICFASNVWFEIWKEDKSLDKLHIHYGVVMYLMAEEITNARALFKMAKFAATRVSSKGANTYVSLEDAVQKRESAYKIVRSILVEEARDKWITFTHK